MKLKLTSTDNSITAKATNIPVGDEFDDKRIVWQIEDDTTQYITELSAKDTEAEYTFYGLTSGRSYSVTIYFKYWRDGSGYITYGDSVTESINTSGSANMDGAEILVIGKTANSLTVQVVGMGTNYEDAASLRWYINGDYWEEQFVYWTEDSNPFELTGLEPNKKYYIEVEIVWDGNNTHTISTHGTTATSGFLPNAYLDAVLKDGSIWAEIRGMGNNYGSVTIDWYVNKKYKKTNSATNTNSVECWLERDGTTNEITAKIFSDNTGDTKTLTKTLELTSTRPTDFYWNSTIESNQPFAITSDEWRKLLNKINEFEEYKGKNTTWFTYPDKGEPFYAYYYNDALTAIANLYNTNWDNYKVKSGDKIEADKILLLSQQLNNIK